MNTQERVDAARQRFAATPVASDFERAFAERYYAHVARGGSPDITRFPAASAKRRTRRILLAALGLVTLLSFAILPWFASESPEDPWALNVFGSFLIASMLGAIPAAVAVVIGRVRLRRSINQMQRDRGAYVEHLLMQAEGALETDRRLMHLGIDL